VFTHFIEGITGFGSTVLALPFAITLLGVASAVPLLSLHAWFLAAFVVITDFRRIVWRQYLIVMAFVLAGLPIGIWSFTVLPEAALKSLLAVFLIGVSLEGLSRFMRHREPETGIPKAGQVLLYILLFLGGIIHGAFSSGGPLIILYVSKTIRDKGNFRATMCAFWFSLNLILLIRNIASGVFSPALMAILIPSLPFLALGTLLGNWAHRVIPGKWFTRMVYLVLLVSGCFMAYAAFPALLGSL
jgi:uncharacterized membrane protein YfcA